MKYFFLTPLVFAFMLMASCVSDPSQSPDSNDAGSAEKNIQEPVQEEQEDEIVINMEESYISFVGGSSIVDHPGEFEEFEVNIIRNEQDPDNPEKASVEAVVYISSVRTDSSGLDGHLMGEDFFDATNYPLATFSSTVIRKIDEQKFSITGTLTVKGMSKPVTMEAQITGGVVTASFDLPRKEFGIGNDSYGDKLLDPLVPVDFKLVFE